MASSCTTRFSWPESPQSQEPETFGTGSAGRETGNSSCGRGALRRFKDRALVWGPLDPEHPYTLESTLLEAELAGIQDHVVQESQLHKAWPL